MTVSDKERETIPLRDGIIAEVIVEASKAGIILSEMSKESAKKYIKAIKLGPDVKGVKEGDLLICNQFELLPAKINIDETHWLLPESVVLAVKR